jgi:hypothetical protein
MIEKKFLDLMNTELDGVNSAKESADLKKYLASNSEAKNYYEDLKTIYGIVDADRDQEPPSDLEDNILSSISFGKYSSGRTNGRDGGWLGKWVSVHRLRYAGAFAVGIIIGVIAYATIKYDGDSDKSFDNSLMYGTMRSIETTDEFEQIQSAGIDLGEINGQIRVYESKQLLIAEVSLGSPGEIEWVLQFDDDVSFEGFRHIDGQDCEVAAARTETRVQQNGNNKYVLFFNNKDHLTTPMVLKIYSADQLLLYEKKLTSAASK